MELNPTANLPIKIVVVGDHLVGKSCAIHSFVTSVAPQQRQSVVIDSTVCKITVDGKIYDLSIWDTTSKEEYKPVVGSLYKDADIFLIFFSVVEPTSLNNAVNKWYSEVKSANERALKVFVGTKIDQRAAANDAKIVHTFNATEEIQNKLKCKYLECSSTTRTGLVNVFESSVKEHLRAKGVLKSYSASNTTNGPGRGYQSQGCCLIM